MNNLKDRVTIYQVAQAAGVSLATVSRVINKQGNVTESTRTKVEATIKKLGYKPSGLAQALATNKTTNIGVIIPGANYVYISNMLSGISEIAKQKGFVLTLFTTSHSREEALSMIEKVITTHVDGTIIFDDELEADDVKKINSYFVPAIVVNNVLTGDKVGCIKFSYGEELKNIIRHYYQDGGEKEMTFVHVHDGGRLLTHCEHCFVEVHNELKREYHVLNCDDSYAHTYADFLEKFKNDPEGSKGYYIAYRDSLAAAIINAASDAGLSVPNDVEVLSLVGTKYANIIRPTLSSMQINMSEVGKRAMLMLTDLINDNLVEKTCRFEAKFVKRSSTKF